MIGVDIMIKKSITKIWYSKTFELISEVNYNVLKVIVEIGGVIGGAIIESFSDSNAEIHKSTNDKYKEYKNETYDYWKNLSSIEREGYFKNNQILQRYGDNYFYDNSEQCAKSISEIAYKENRKFVDKYDKY